MIDELGRLPTKDGLYWCSEECYAESCSSGPCEWKPSSVGSITSSRRRVDDGNEIAQRFAKDGIEIVRCIRQSRHGVSSVTYMKRPDDIAAHVERRYKLGDRTLRIEAVCQEGSPLIGEIATSHDIGRRCWWAESAGD